MIAAEVGNLDALNFLLHKDLNVNFEVNSETAASHAIANGLQRVVLALFNANSWYPTNFNYELVTDELNFFVDLSTIFVDLSTSFVTEVEKIQINFHPKLGKLILI